MAQPQDLSQYHARPADSNYGINRILVYFFALIKYNIVYESTSSGLNGRFIMFLRQRG